MDTNARLLVIDDEKGIREGCRRVLAPAGYRVSLAESFAAGQAQLAAEDFDLVLLDIMLPDGRGIDLLEPLHARDPDLVCIIITGYATVELAVEAIHAGAYDFISKPFTADQLLLKVEQGLEKRRLAQANRRLQTAEARSEQLAREREALERLERQKSAFMNTVAHELRAPISGAQSLVRTLLHGYAGQLDEGPRALLARIEARLSTLLELVNDLLDLAASKSFTPETPLEEVLLVPQLVQVREYFQAEARERGLSLVMQAPADGIPVLATEDGLQRIFSNLVGNAVKYSPDGGRVQIHVRPGPEEVQVEVRDSGIGIPADQQERLFEEFFRARNAKQSGIGGTGLGLSIVRQLVERFGGRVAVQSEEGEGSVFTVTLPRAKDG